MTNLSMELSGDKDRQNQPERLVLMYIYILLQVCDRVRSTYSIIGATESFHGSRKEPASKVQDHGT